VISKCIITSAMYANLLDSRILKEDKEGEGEREIYAILTYMLLLSMQFLYYNMIYTLELITSS